ncbi:MAG: GbsR/MarR family transcriptional regulator, partial [Gammaproteobacteria bacterium]
GEMGGKWGINRIAAQVFALLYLSPRPMHAPELCETLRFSRSHIGSALKDLERWRLVSVRHVPGDRRDHFAAVDDVWTIARTLAEERRRREIEPTRAMLGETVEMRPKTAEERHMHAKISEMHDLMRMLTDWHDDMQKMETRQLARMLKLGAKAASLYSRAAAPSKKRSRRGG